MPDLVISRKDLDQIVTHCRACYPDEACGILSGTGDRVMKVFLMTNAEPSPVSYVMDPGEQFRVMKEMRREGQAMVAIFHSHPQSPAFPSSIDMSLAFYDDAVYLIIGLTDPKSPEIRAYRIIANEVKDVSVKILD